MAKVALVEGGGIRPNVLVSQPRTAITRIEGVRASHAATLLHELRTGIRKELPADVRQLCIGRSRRADIRVMDRAVSARQCILERHSLCWSISAHSKSRQMTLVNGIPLSPGAPGVPLLVGTVIHAGKSAWIGLDEATPVGEVVLSGITMREFMACARLVFGSDRAAAAWLDVSREENRRLMKRAREVYPLPKARAGRRPEGRRGRAVIMYGANGVIAAAMPYAKFLKEYAEDLGDESSGSEEAGIEDWPGCTGGA